MATTPPAPVETAAAPSDSLSPTEAVLPYEKFPVDKLQTPQTIIDKLQANQPMLIFWYDKTTQVSKDERIEIDTVLKKYRGLIDLVAFDYNAGLSKIPGSTPTSVPPEVSKFELTSAQLRVHTTPYVMFVDRYGRITYRFAGYVDSALLERETLRATR